MSNGMKTIKNKEDLIFHIVPFLIGFLITYISVHSVLSHSGYIVLAEQLEVYSLDRFIDVFYPTWCSQVQAFPLADFIKLYLYGSLAIIAKVFNLSFRELEIIMLASPFFIGFVSMYYLAKYFIVKISSTRIPTIVSSLASAFIYVINPWMANMPRNIYLRFEFSLLPLIYLSFIKMIEKPSMRNIMIFSFISSFILDYKYIVVLTPLFVIASIFAVISKQIPLRKMLKILLTSASLFILLIAGRLLPPLLYSLNTPLEVARVFTVTMIRREPILKVFMMYFMDWGGSEKFELTYSGNFYQLFLPITIFSFIYLLCLRNKNRNAYLYFLPSTIFLFYILLVSKEVNADSFILSLPYSDYIGRILHMAYFNCIPIIMSLSICIGLSLTSLYSRLKGILFYTSFLIVLLLSSASAWPIFTGDMNGYWHPTEIPEDYINLNNNLASERYSVHALWMPTYAGNKAIWSNAQTPYEVGAPTGAFNLFSSALTTYCYSNFYFFDYYSPVYDWRYGLLSRYKGLNWGEIFSPLNVKYLLIHYDVAWTSSEKRMGQTNEYIKAVVEQLKGDRTLNTIYQGEYLTAFEVKNVVPHIRIAPVVLMEGGLRLYATLMSASRSAPLIIYYDSTINPAKAINYTKYMVFENTENILEHFLPIFTSSKLILSPASYAERLVDPSKIWSYSPSVSDWAFQYYLKTMNIEEWRWDFDYGQGLVYTWALNTTLRISFNIETDGDYVLFIRSLQNIKGGTIMVYLDEKPVGVVTKDQLNKFSWKKLGSFHLDKGKHEIVLENAKGFNAVNLFSLIPEEDYYKAKGVLEELLQNKILIYLYEAESDLYRSNCRIVENADASNGEILAFEKNGRAWLDIEIVKNGTYRLALKGVGAFEVSIGDEKFIVESLDLQNFSYSPLFSLEKGRYRMEIKPLDGAMLDVIWLYSTEANQTVEDLFEVGEKAEIISYEMVDSTLWKVKVNATKPFMLSFAEAYDPLWEVRVYKYGRLVEKVSPTSLYGVINGFWIDENGYLEIVIRYKPQDWFELGLALSTATFAGCVVYLLYEWRRSRGDLWAIKLEGLFARFSRKKSCV
jgi:hypothetical protein